MVGKSGKRGVRNRSALPSMTEEQILQWAESYFESTGLWPKYDSGPLAYGPGETWAAIDSALRYGKRGLAGKSGKENMMRL